MSNFDPALRTAVDACIIAAATAVGHTLDERNILKRSEINQMDWATLIRGGDLVPPFAVVNIGSRSEVPWGGALTLYQYPVDVTYIFSRNDELIDDDPEGFADSFSSALRDGFYLYASDAFQCPNRPTIDNSDENPANSVFYQRNHPLFASRVSALLIAGELYGT